MSFEIISETASFGGTQGYYKHAASSTSCDMRFSVFTPPQATEGQKDKKVPVLWYLSGLTCTEDNATAKAGFQRVAA
ncbi:MAG: S-formylglutathione hydrolase, partial [Kordiimonadaceae bacterium]|nr:S-formylglutathione hydrolase [Kordiimonadaceae bacterium]